MKAKYDEVELTLKSAYFSYLIEHELIFFCCGSYVSVQLWHSSLTIYDHVNSQGNEKSL